MMPWNLRPKKSCWKTDGSFHLPKGGSFLKKLGISGRGEVFRARWFFSGAVVSFGDRFFRQAMTAITLVLSARTVAWSQDYRLIHWRSPAGLAARWIIPFRRLRSSLPLLGRGADQVT